MSIVNLFFINLKSLRKVLLKVIFFGEESLEGSADLSGLGHIIHHLTVREVSAVHNFDRLLHFRHAIEDTA